MLTAKKGVLIAAGMCGLPVVFCAFPGSSKSTTKGQSASVPAMTGTHAEPARVGEAVSNAPLFPNTSAPTVSVARAVGSVTQQSGPSATVPEANRSMKVTNPDGSTTSYSYGPDGRCMSAKTCYADGRLKLTDQFNYDAEGNRLGVRRQRPDGSIAVKQIAYDASGKEFTKRIINKDGTPGTEDEWNRWSDRF